MFELTDSMRFNVDLNSEFCNNHEKIQNQEIYKNYVTNLHHKTVTDQD